MSEDLEQLIRRRQDSLRGYPLPPERRPSIARRWAGKVLAILDNQATPLACFGFAAIFYTVSLILKLWDVAQ